MQTTCPNCDLTTDVMTFLPAGFDVPACDACGFSIYGYSYTLCPSCNMLYRRDLPACPVCGKALDNSGNGNGHSAGLQLRESDTLKYVADSEDGSRFTIDPLRNGQPYLVELITEQDRVSSVVTELRAADTALDRY